MKTIEEQKNDAPGQNKQVTIYVNSTPESWIGKEITFEQLVALAFNNPPKDDTKEYTVRYSKGEGNKAGSMVIGDSVKVKSEMVFDVTATNKS